MYQVDDSSTEHGLLTPHGFNTPHRFPTKTSTENDLLALSQQLYPTGRAWYLPENSDFRALHQAVNLSFLRLIEDAFGLTNSLFPDNEYFDEGDAGIAEYRYGIAPSAGATLAQRMLNIEQAMTFPQNIIYRQGYLYVQAMLQAVGFDVYVIENIFFNEDGSHYYKTPEDILGEQVSSTEHGGATEHGGGTQHGGGNYDVIANSEQGGEDYSIGGNLWPTWFLCGPGLTTATISAAREVEFRRLVLSLKPMHTVAYLFVNYV